MHYLSHHNLITDEQIYYRVISGCVFRDLVFHILTSLLGFRMLYQFLAPLWVFFCLFRFVSNEFDLAFLYSVSGISIPLQNHIFCPLIFVFPFFNLTSDSSESHVIFSLIQLSSFSLVACYSYIVKFSTSRLIIFVSPMSRCVLHVT
jgi:hypothetical protein